MNEYFRLGLADKLAKVRQKTAESAIEYQRKDLLPHIERILLTEGNMRTARFYEASVTMLRNGYLIGRDDDGHPILTFKTQRSTVHHQLEPHQRTESAIRKIIEEKIAADQLAKTDLLRTSCWTESSFTVDAVTST
jgi:hypothetical protein